MTARLPNFTNCRVLVLGDVMLDRYWHGQTARISPEAPVPVVKVGQHDFIPGGAANVAVNIAALGAKVTLLGLVGEDEAAAKLASLLHEAKVGFRLTPTKYPTVTKLRVMSRHQQLIRLDFEEPYPAECLPELHEQFEAAIKHVDVVILSDYGKGALQNAKELIAIAKRYEVPVFVDPKNANPAHYEGATLLTPNFKEFEEMVGHAVESDDALLTEAKCLIEKADLQNLLVTRGEKGMTLVSRNAEEVIHLKAQARDVFDVTGAGDTVMAVLATAYAGGLSLGESAELANIAAGLVVAKSGTASVTEAELLAALPKNEFHKQYSQDECLLLVNAAKARGERIVMTNGCFDVLHAGHVQYLTQAKALGDRFIMAVNDDDSVRRLKGPQRPLNPLSERMQVLAGLEAIDWVVSFSEDTPQCLIEMLLPDVLVKGGDYKVEDIAGHEAVLANGGEVIIIPFKDGCSTTGLVERIIERSQQEEV